MISVYSMPDYRCTKCLGGVYVNLSFKEDGSLRVHIVHPQGNGTGFICPDENQIIELGDPDIMVLNYG